MKVSWHPSSNQFSVGIKSNFITYSVELFVRAKLGSNQLVHSPTRTLIEFFSRFISLICLRYNVVFTDFGASWFPMSFKQISVLSVFSAQLINSAKLNSKRHTKVIIDINIFGVFYELYLVRQLLSNWSIYDVFFGMWRVVLTLLCRQGTGLVMSYIWLIIISKVLKNYILIMLKALSVYKTLIAYWIFL